MHCSHIRRHKTVNISLFSIIIPYDNLKDLDKIDADLRKNVEFYPVKDLKQVLAVSFPGILDKVTPKL